MIKLGKRNRNKHKFTRKDMNDKHSMIIKPLSVTHKPGQKGSNNDKPDKIIGGSAERSYFGDYHAAKQKKQGQN